MFTITKAVSEDFDRVYPLFLSFADAPISRDNWKKIFVSPWLTKEDFCGYLLLRDGEVKGYLGVIFSRRVLDGKVEKFCNMTSWVVSEDCRGQSIRLLVELLKLKGYTLTNFSASPAVAIILLKVGFTEFAVDQRILLPLPNLSFKSPCNFSLPANRNELGEHDRRIFEDHQGLDCQHLLLRSHEGQCYLVLRRTTRKHLPFAKVHYLSNAEVFSQCIEQLVARICFRLKVMGIMVDERYIGGRVLRASVKYPHQRKAYFKSDMIMDSDRIDTIYSEMVILHY